MAKHPTEAIRLHYKLFVDIGARLPTSGQHFKAFVTMVQSLLTERDVKPNGESVEDILKALESQGHIAIGSYGKLIQCLKDAGLKSLSDFVLEEEKVIKRRLSDQEASAKETLNTSSQTDNGQQCDVAVKKRWNKWAVSVLIVINIAMMVFGVLMFSIGIWLLLDDDINHLIRLLYNSGLTVSTVCIFSFGCFAVFVGILGVIYGIKSLLPRCHIPCLSSCSLSRNIDNMHVVSMIGAFGCGLGVGLIILLCSNLAQRGLTDKVLTSVKSYNPGSSGNAKYAINLAWDTIQVKFQCCGANNYTDYINILGEKVVPKTCCYLTNKDPLDPIPKDKARCRADAINNAKTSQYLHTNNCLPFLTELLKYYSAIVLGVGIAFSFLLVVTVIVIIFLMCYFVNTKTPEKDRTFQRQQQATPLVPREHDLLNC